jgi:hypothetical protein
VARSKTDDEKVVVGNPNVPSYHHKVDAKKYHAMREALLKIVPRTGRGITQNEMMKAVGSQVPKDLFPAMTFMWWAKCVQLDMESKRELWRDKTAKPLRWKLADGE